MKICLAQTRSFKGDMEAGIKAHLAMINVAVDHNTDAIFFPELSLTGYEPELATKLATTANDPRLNSFQEVCDSDNLLIGLGLPLQNGADAEIGMIFFQPGEKSRTYSKQHLHEDELAFFKEGNKQLFLPLDKYLMAPAICYESLLPEHAAIVALNGVDLYMASTAKSKVGVSKAYQHYPGIARQHGMRVLMCNAVGHADNFISAGKSAVWDKNGAIIAQLDEDTQGLLIVDMDTNDSIVINMN